jgi:peroxiredoxin
MSSTPSKMVPLGTAASDFTLLDTVTGKNKSLHKLKSNIATVVFFICNHCPYVLHVKKELVNIAKEYQARGISFIAISSNDVTQYPQDGPEKMKIFAAENNFSFPYLYDENQQVARAYDAQCTPDIYVYDNNLKLVYRGQLDDSRPSNDIPVTGSDLRAALDSILNSIPVNPNQKPSIGCNIKWK